jgi:hypothetical protein
VILEFPAGKSVVAEVYPALWSRSFPRENRDVHQHDAYSIAAWMRQADSNGSLSTFAGPPLDEADRRAAEIEGWILGVMCSIAQPTSVAMLGLLDGHVRSQGNRDSTRMPQQGQE